MLRMLRTRKREGDLCNALTDDCSTNSMGFGFQHKCYLGRNHAGTHEGLNPAAKSAGHRPYRWN